MKTTVKRHLRKSKNKTSVVVKHSRITAGKQWRNPKTGRMVGYFRAVQLGLVKTKDEGKKYKPLELMSKINDRGDIEQARALSASSPMLRGKRSKSAKSIKHLAKRLSKQTKGQSDTDYRHTPDPSSFTRSFGGKSTKNRSGRFTPRMGGR